MYVIFFNWCMSNFLVVMYKIWNIIEYLLEGVSFIIFSIEFVFVLLDRVMYEKG